MVVGSLAASIDSSSTTICISNQEYSGLYAVTKLSFWIPLLARYSYLNSAPGMRPARIKEEIPPTKMPLLAPAPGALSPALPQVQLLKQSDVKKGSAQSGSSS